MQLYPINLYSIWMLCDTQEGNCPYRKTENRRTGLKAGMAITGTPARPTSGMILPSPGPCLRIPLILHKTGKADSQAGFGQFPAGRSILDPFGLRYNQRGCKSWGENILV